MFWLSGLRTHILGALELYGPLALLKEIVSESGKARIDGLSPYANEYVPVLFTTGYPRKRLQQP